MKTAERSKITFNNIRIRGMQNTPGGTPDVNGRSKRGCENKYLVSVDRLNERQTTKRNQVAHPSFVLRLFRADTCS